MRTLYFILLKIKWENKQDIEMRCPSSLCCQLAETRRYNRKVMSSISDAVFEIFHRFLSLGHSMTLGTTQPLTKLSITNFSVGTKAASLWGWQPFHFHVPVFWKSWKSVTPEALVAHLGLYRVNFIFNFYHLRCSVRRRRIFVEVSQKIK